MKRIALAGALALGCLSSAPASAMGYFNAQNAAITCAVLLASEQTTLTVLDAINSGKATPVVRTGTTQTVTVATAALCQSLGGVIKATAPASK